MMGAGWPGPIRDGHDVSHPLPPANQRSGHSYLAWPAVMTYRGLFVFLGAEKRIGRPCTRPQGCTMSCSVIACAQLPIAIRPPDRPTCPLLGTIPSKTYQAARARFFALNTPYFRCWLAGRRMEVLHDLSAPGYHSIELCHGQGWTSSAHHLCCPSRPARGSQPSGGPGGRYGGLRDGGTGSCCWTKCPWRRSPKR